jgi:hypothetical protein
MFGKHFASCYTGSMVGSGLAVFGVWGYVIANTRKDGTVELNPVVLAAILGCKAEEIEAAIAKLLEPDLKSRSRREDGRRLIQKGPYLYGVTTYEDYRAIRDDGDRREYMRNYMREYRDPVNSAVNTNVNSGKPQLADAEADVDAEELHPPPPAHEEAQSSTGSTAQAMISITPAEFRPDMEALLNLVPTVTSWTAEMRAALEGMHGKPLTVAQLGQAVRDYMGSGKPQKGASLRSFRRYMQGVLETGDVPHGNSRPKGMTGAAAALIALIRKRKNQQFPNSIPPNWGDDINERVQGIVKPFLPRIFADDMKGEGTLLAQLARAMEEAAE